MIGYTGNTILIIMNEWLIIYDCYYNWSQLVWASIFYVGRTVPPGRSQVSISLKVSLVNK